MLSITAERSIRRDKGRCSNSQSQDQSCVLSDIGADSFHSYLRAVPLFPDSGHP